MSKDKDETAINLLFEVYDAGIGNRTVDLTGYLNDIKQALTIPVVVGTSVCDEPDEPVERCKCCKSFHEPDVCCYD